MKESHLQGAHSHSLIGAHTHSVGARSHSVSAYNHNAGAHTHTFNTEH